MPDNQQHQPFYPSPAIRNNAGNISIATNSGTGSREFGAGIEKIISPTFVLWVLNQWWKIALPIGLLSAVVAAGVVIYTYVPKYRAQAMLMIEDRDPYIAFSNGGRSSDRFINTQLELLKSPIVLEPVISDEVVAELPEIAQQKDRVGYLRQKLLVRPIGRSELYDISYESTSPAAAATVVNNVILEYLELQSKDQVERSQSVMSILQGELQRREGVVEQKRKQVVEMAKDVTGVDPFTGQLLDYDGASATPIALLFGQLTALDVEREVLKAQLLSIGSTEALEKDPMEASGLLDVEIETRSEVSQRLNVIAAIKARMEEVKARALHYFKDSSWEDDATYIGLQKDLARVEKEVEEVKTKARTIVLKQRSEQRKYDRDQEIAKLEMQLSTLETRRGLLASRLDKQIADAQTGEGKSVELEFARASLAREEKVFELIASRMLALQTEANAPRRVYLRQTASVPVMPVEKIPYKLLLVAASAAFAAPFAAAVAREATVRRISDVDQLSRESGLRVLGEIAALPVRHVAMSPNKLSRRLRRDAYIFAESINSLRTNIAVADSISAQQVIAVTSALSSEGKTSIATSLAMSIANATESPTLIIDGDMRSPDVSKLLKSRNGPGLFEFLSNKCSLDAAIHRVGDSNVYVMPGGRANRNPHNTVRPAEIQQMLAQLRERFPSILIDTPPILGASESLVLARAADGALFCSLSAVSRSKQVRLAVDRLHHAGVNVVGAVLSGTSSSRYACTYGYYASQGEINS